jgi:CHAT domain-containing protein
VGVLNAYQIHKLDLRSVELLTLSACETGLGRIDAGDNIGGLPASFMLAGVQSIVATLWPVAPNVSRIFFTRMYLELRNGSAKMDAFYLAQSATRKDFPAYRDWGAFFFSGNWN